MSVGGRMSEQATMDVLLRANPPLSYGGDRTALTREDVSLRQLEQECLQFFESTIDSLEKSFEEGEEQIQPETPSLPNNVFAQPTTAAAATFHSVTPVPSSSPAHSSPLQTRTSNPRDHDIIDLVRPEPDLVPRKEAFYNATAPDFQNVVAIPSSHLETKPRHESADLKASEYNPPLPSGSSYRPHDVHSSYCPPGCVPTPVLIAQKMAENQGSGTSNIGPSTLYPRKSLESDHTVKQGPPISTKPTRFPANISVIHGSKESNQSLANVNIYERQAQMLANLPGVSPYLGQDETELHAADQKGNVPTRSVSFRDPTPDKSRMEALSKLGLRNRAQSGGGALYIAPQSATPGATAADLPRDSEIGVRSPVTVQHPSRPAASEIRSDRKQDTVPVDLTSSSSSSVEKSVHVKPSPVEAASRSNYQPVKIERKLSSVSPPPPEVVVNSYGGKTVVIKPSVSSKGEHLPAPGSLDGKAPVGNIVSRGHSRVISPGLPRNDLPDILSAHIDHSWDLLPPPPPTVEVNNFGGRTRTINPTAAAGGNPNSPARATAKPPAPSTAPKPLRHHVSMNLPRPRATSPEPRRKSTSSKAVAFRPQGITVQFSGKGAMDESRRAALRKLGLMKDTY
ncbi:hypothetical protein CRUP_025853 [Coryphaenoides rupestris]|nr:hypothetical protein CRUP_025853 [Coryphaenoides rupestris]